MLYLKTIDLILTFLPKKQSKTGHGCIKPDKKVLVANLGHIGDGLFTVAATSIIKETYPAAQVDLLVGSWNKELLSKYSHISKVHCYDHPFQNRKNISFSKKCKIGVVSFIKSIKDIRKESYDVAIDLRVHYPNAIFLLFCSKISIRAGFTSGGYKKLLTFPMLWDSSLHMLQSYQKLLRNVFDCNHLQLPQLFLPKLKELNSTVLEMIASNYVVCHLFSGDRRRDLSLAFWDSLVQSLKSLGFKIVFTGTTHSLSDQVRVDKMAAKHSVYNLCNKLEFVEFIEVIQRSKSVVSVDTVAGHLAAIFKKVIVSLYTTASNPVNWKPSAQKLKIFKVQKDNQTTVQDQIKSYLLEQENNNF